MGAAPVAQLAGSAGTAALPARLGSGLFERRVQLFFQLLALGCLAGLIVTAGAAAATGSTAMLLVAGGCAAFLITALPLVLRREMDPFEPMTYAAVSVLIGVTLRTLYLALSRNPEAAAFSLLHRPIEVLAGPMVIVLLGLLALSAGYLLPMYGLRVPLKRLLPGENWSRRRLAVVVVGLSAISILAGIIFFRRLGLTYIVLTSLEALSAKRRLDVGGTQLSSLAYLRWGATAVSIAFYVYLAQVAVSRTPISRRVKITLVVLGLLSVIFPFVVSSRSSVLRVMVYAMIVWFYLRGKVSTKAVSAVAIVAILVFSVMGALRAFAHKGETEQLGALTGVAGVAEMLMIDRHFLDITKTSHIIEAVPDRVEWAHGATLFTWIFAPIPRTLWPDKPVVRPGLVLGMEVFGAPDQRGAVPPGAVAELWMNFGMAGVLVGMFVLGAVLRFVYVSFRPYLRSSKAAVLMYMFFGFDFTRFIFDTEFAAASVSLIQNWITMGLVLLFLSRSRVAGERVPQTASV